MVQVNQGLAMDWLRLQGLEAYGTSAGVKKAWDSRGRGRTKKALSPRKMSNKQMVTEHKRLLTQYKTLGQRIDHLSKKMADASEVKGTAWKFLHLMKHAGEWVTAFKDLVEVTAVAGTAVYAAMNAQSHVLTSVLSWAYAHSAVVMNYLAGIDTNSLRSIADPAMAGL